MPSKMSLAPGARLVNSFKFSKDSPVCWKDYYDAALVLCDYTMGNYITYTRADPQKGSRKWAGTTICVKRTPRVEPHVNAEEYERMFDEIVDIILKYRKDKNGKSI